MLCQPSEYVERFKIVPVPAYRPYLVFPPIATRTIDETTQAIKLKNIIFLGRRTCNKEKIICLLTIIFRKRQII